MAPLELSVKRAALDTDEGSLSPRLDTDEGNEGMSRSRIIRQKLVVCDGTAFVSAARNASSGATRTLLKKEHTH